MVTLTITDPTYQSNKIHLKTRFELAYDPNFSKDSVFYVIETEVDKLQHFVDMRLNPNIAVYSRAFVLLQPGGWHPVKNIDIVDTKDENDLQHVADMPSTISAPKIKTTCPREQHGNAHFEIMLSGFNVQGSASLIASSYIIEDTTGRVWWKRIFAREAKERILVDSVTLDWDRAYLIKAYFHSSTGDVSQCTVYPIITHNPTDIEVIEPLQWIDNTIDVDLHLRTDQVPEQVKWEVCIKDKDFYRVILRSITKGIKFTLPSNTLYSTKDYILKVKTNNCKGWRYENMTGHGFGDINSDKSYAPGDSIVDDDTDTGTDGDIGNGGQPPEGEEEDETIDLDKDYQHNWTDKDVLDEESWYEEDGVTISGESKLKTPDIIDIRSEINSDGKIEATIVLSDFKVLNGYDEHEQTFFKCSSNKNFTGGPGEVNIDRRLDPGILETIVLLEDSFFDREIFLRVKHTGKFLESTWSAIKSFTMEDNRGVEAPLWGKVESNILKFPYRLFFGEYKPINTTVDNLPLSRIVIQICKSKSFEPDKTNEIVIEKDDINLVNGLPYYDLQTDDLPADITRTFYIKFLYTGIGGRKEFESGWSVIQDFKVISIMTPRIDSPTTGQIFSDTFTVTTSNFVCEDLRVSHNGTRVQVTTTGDFDNPDLDEERAGAELRALVFSNLDPTWYNRDLSIRVKYVSTTLESDWSEPITIKYGDLFDTPIVNLTRGDNGLATNPTTFFVPEIVANGVTELKPREIHYMFSDTPDFSGQTHEQAVTVSDNPRDPSKIAPLELLFPINDPTKTIYVKAAVSFGLKKTPYGAPSSFKLPYIHGMGLTIL